MLEQEEYNIGDIVMMKVDDIEINNLRNYIAINKTLPKETPKLWGHSFHPNIHIYAAVKNKPHHLYIVYTPRIGVIKEPEKSEMENVPKYVKHKTYTVQWQERSEANYMKGHGRHLILETYYPENIVAMKDIQKFVKQDELEDYYHSYCREQKENLLTTDKAITYKV